MKRWLRSIQLLLGVAAIYLILAFLKLPNSTILWREIHNTGHTPLFGMLALLVLGLSINNFKNIQRRWIHYIMAFVLAALLGLLLEIWQIWGPGDADIYDLMRDIGGAVSFLGFYSLISGSAKSWQIGKSKRIRLIILILSLTAIIASLIPLAHLTGSYIYRNNIFPEICDFNPIWESKFLYTRDAALKDPPDSIVNRFENRNMAQIGFFPAQYPTFTIEEPYPDWRSFNTFHMEVYSPLDRIVDLTVSIEDFHHNQNFNDRLNYTYQVNPGINNIDIPIEIIRMAPLTREMDISRIRAIHLFASNTYKEFWVYIGNICLK